MREYNHVPHVTEQLKDTPPDVRAYIHSLENELVHIMAIAQLLIDGDAEAVLSESPWDDMADLRQDLTQSIEYFNQLRDGDSTIDL